MESRNYLPFMLVFFCVTAIVGCKRQEDNYVFDQANLSSKGEIDTVSVNEPVSITMTATMPNCCGAEFLLTEINSTDVSRTIKVDGRYEGDYPGYTMPETKQFQYRFTPSQKGNFFLYCAQSDGSYAIDTFFVR